MNRSSNGFFLYPRLILCNPWSVPFPPGDPFSRKRLILIVLSWTHSDTEGLTVWIRKAASEELRNQRVGLEREGAQSGRLRALSGEKFKGLRAD